MVDRLALHLGRRGTLLLLLGVLWVAYGTTILQGGSRPIPEAAGLWHEQIPHVIRGSAWVLSGVLAAALGALRGRRDQIGYAGLIGMPLVHVTSNLGSASTYLISDGARGWEYAPATAVIWSVICIVILVVAGWPDADPAGVYERRRP